MQKIAISYTRPDLKFHAEELSQALQLPCVALSAETFDYLLVITETHIELRSTREKISPIFIDFLKGKSAYRALKANRRNELLARAVGMKAQKKLKILDVTAGLGRDAFLLAYLGCEVLMLERSPIIAVLLEDGLKRAYYDERIQRLSLKLIKKDARDYLMQLTDYPDVIYMDPMFPDSKKSALVKKEMRFLRNLVGEDPDASELLKLSLQKAKERVVVKRHRLAEIIPGPKPDLEFKGQSSRFDIYLTKAQW